MSSAVVLSHRNVAHELGHLEPWFERNGFRVRRIFRGDMRALPDADLLVVLGSPKSVATGYCEPASDVEIAKKYRSYTPMNLTSNAPHSLGGSWTLWHEDAISAPASSTLLATMEHADTVFAQGSAWGVQPHIEFTPEIVARLGQAIYLSPDRWEPMYQAMKDDEPGLAERAGLFLDTFWANTNSLV